MITTNTTVTTATDWTQIYPYIFETGTTNNAFNKTLMYYTEEPKYRNWCDYYYYDTISNRMMEAINGIKKKKLKKIKADDLLEFL